MIFRFDSVSGNTNFTLLYDKIDYLREKIKCWIWLSFSPLYNSRAENGRIYKEYLDDLSDHRNFFFVNMCKLHKPKREGVEIVSHGLVYTDHRLLTYEQQEFSILTACSLLDSKKFVPPFNKWNKDTEKICSNHLISLIKTEDSWTNFKQTPFSIERVQWFLQSYELTLEQFKQRIDNAI